MSDSQPVRAAPKTTGRGDDAGFTLVGLLVVVAVINLTMMVAVTSWVTLDKRAREAELIFRGQAIAGAISCYQLNNAGQPLQRLDQLVETSCLRRLYRDPMVKGGEWRILRQDDLANGTIAQLLGLETEQDAGQNAATPPPGIRAGLQLVPANGGGTGRGAAAVLLQQARARLLQGPSSSGQQIIGVVSTSRTSGLREFRTRRSYGDWVFLAGS